MPSLSETIHETGSIHVHLIASVTMVRIFLFHFVARLGACFFWDLASPRFLACPDPQITEIPAISFSSTKRPLFVVVVFINRQPRLVRFGLNADVTATFLEVKKCLADATDLSVDQVILNLAFVTPGNLTN